MKKIIVAIVAIIMLLPMGATKANAQNFVYQGDAALGYGFGTGDPTLNRFIMTTTHGFRLNRYLFAGAGLGFNFYKGDDNGISKSATYLPVFASFRGYYPIASNLNLVGYVDLGYGFMLGHNDELVKPRSGFYCYPQFGINIPVWGDKQSFDFTIGYHHQIAELKELESSNNIDAIAFKIAFNW